MKRIFKLLSMMLAVSTALSSCLGDDEETFITTYRDMMIETFTLGTLNRYQTYTSSTGSDSVVKTMFSGSQYPMTIDHVNRIIYNQDSLPMGTDTRHVICTITAKNNGVVYLKLLDRDSLYYHNSTDSVDFSVERIFRVYAIDGYRPTNEGLLQTDLRDIIKYLHLSHAYYMDVALKELAAALEQMIEPCDAKRKKVIWRFFTDYKEELAKHFEYEEKRVFPHVEAVLNHTPGEQFTIGEYEENHSNVEEKLDDLKNLVMKYLPVQCDQQQIYKALFYIFMLETDLRKHTVIEDEILVPVVGRMEGHE